MFARLLCSAFVLSALIFSGATALAGNAAQFVGIYNIVSPPPQGEPEYFLVDNDTLQVIWDRYAESTLPADLEPYKNELVILAGFTDRDFLILAFEEVSTIQPRYLKLLGSEDELIELYQRTDGRYDMGTRQAGQVQIYLLDAPVPLPSPVRKTILIKNLPRLQRF